MGLSGLFLILFFWILIAYFTTSYQNKKRLEEKKKELVEHCFPSYIERTPNVCLKKYSISEIHKIALEKITE